MFKSFTALFAAAVSLCFGEFHSFEKNGVSFEWENAPDYGQCKRVFMDAFLKCYTPIPLEILRKSSHEEMVAWLESAYDEMYQEYREQPGSHLQWLTAKIEGEAVACLLIDMEKYPEEVYLSQMAVDPVHQRRGIAREMVCSIFDQLPDAKKMVVITRKANQEATEFYHAFGFQDSDYIHEGYSRELYRGFELKRE